MIYHGNEGLINLAAGVVVKIVFLPVGRLKLSLRCPPSETYRCGRCGGYSGMTRARTDKA